MTSARLAKLGPDRFPWAWALWSDYDPQLVEAIKERIYYRFRKWDKDSKCWLFTAEAISNVLFIVETYCGIVDHEESQVKRTLSEQDIKAYRVLHLLPSAPKELVRAAYKTVAKLSHPDMGGTTAQMQAVNAAYERLIVGD